MYLESSMFRLNLCLFICLLDFDREFIVQREEDLVSMGLAFILLYLYHVFRD